MAELISINLGAPRTIPGKRAKTGIYKEPVADAEIGRLGLAGDAVMDSKHHGGVDQAVYVYFADDYRWWSGELGYDVAPGTFGENLTIDGVEGATVAVGDRFTIGDVVLEVTSHRQPCSTLSARMGKPIFVKRFMQAGLPGAYCRVIVPGTVTAGSPVTYAPFAGERVTVAELMAIDGKRAPDPEVMRRALGAPVHYKLRDLFESKLAQLF